VPHAEGVVVTRRRQDNSGYPGRAGVFFTELDQTDFRNPSRNETLNRISLFLPTDIQKITREEANNEMP
jgi:hypothetical protein